MRAAFAVVPPLARHPRPRGSPAACAMALAAALATPDAARGQSTVPATLANYRQARDVLDAAIVAHGGDAAVRATEDISVAFDGRRHMAYQSHTLSRPWNVQADEWRLVIDLRNSRVKRESVSRYPKDFVFAGRQVIAADGGWWVDPNRQGTGDAIVKIGREAFNSARAGALREVPVFILIRARERSATLRSLGAVTEGGRRHDVITYAEPDGAQITLFVDAASKLLTRYEALRDDGIVGDQALGIAFGEYRSIGGLQLPARRIETRNGELTREGTLTYAVNTRPPDSLFVAPSGYAEPAPAGPEGEPIRKLADNVWLLQALPGGNRVLFVAFNDHVLVFEAPLPQAAAQAVMDAVRKTVPGKPIRYVTFSHHHDDHAGGLRPYIAEGITIVTTPTNKRFVEQLAAATHTIAPDTLSRSPRPPVIETFSGKRIFTDGTMTVELHELGRNSHVDEMTLAYLPSQRLIFQGDLVILPNQGEVPPANTLTEEFLRKIDAMRWPVETIAGVHGRVGTLEDLRRAVAKRVAAK